MSKAFIIVDNVNVSAGQLILINAMRFGKPLTVAEGESMIDYIDESYAIIVEPKSPDRLLDIITQLDGDSLLLKKMGESAYNTYNNLFTIKKYAERVHELLVS